MLRHVVLARWIEGTPPERVADVTAALSGLPAQIPSIRAYTYGPDLQLAEGRYDYAIVADFDDVEGWRAYDTDPVHEKVRADLIAPIIDQRVSVQFEL